MFGRKRIKELEEKVDLLRKTLNDSNQKIELVSAANYKYKHLFFEMFNRLSISNVVKYKVTKDLTNINDEKTLFCVKYDDGRSFVYEVKLVSTEYEEDLNGKNE